MRVIALAVLVVFAATQIEAAIYLGLDKTECCEFDRYVITTGSDWGLIPAMQVNVEPVFNGRLNDFRPEGISTIWQDSLTDEVWNYYGLDRTLDTCLLFEGRGTSYTTLLFHESEQGLSAAFTGFNPFDKKAIANIVVPEDQGFNLQLAVLINKEEYWIQFDLGNHAAISKLKLEFTDFSNETGLIDDMGNPVISIHKWGSQYNLNFITYSNGVSYQSDGPAYMLNLPELAFSIPGALAQNVIPEPASAIFFALAIPAILTRRRVR